MSRIPSRFGNGARFFHLLFVIMLAGFGRSKAADILPPETQQKDAAASGWQFSIEPIDGSKILVNQPVTLNTKLEYKSNTPFVGVLSSLKGGRSWLEITRDGKSLSFGLDALFFGFFADEFPTSPGILYKQGFVQEQAATMLFDFRNHKYLFSTPGQYTLRLSTTAWEGKNSETYKIVYIKSNPITITVAQPPAKERPALELWNGEEQAFVLTRSSYRDIEKAPGVEKLKQLIQRYPTTSYAMIAKRHLARIAPTPVLRLFPEDKRLSAKITIPDTPSFTAYEEFFKSYSQQSGVPLDASPELKRRQRSSKSRSVELRSEMERIAVTLEATWKKRGKGYFLSEDKDAKKQALQEQMAGIAPAPVVRLFPEDKRLSAKITIPDTPRFTAYEEFFKSYSQQSGVPLDASPQLKQHQMSSMRQVVELRDEMKRIAESISRLWKVNATWKKRGNGYYLSEDGGTKKQLQEPTQNSN